MRGIAVFFIIVVNKARHEHHARATCPSVKRDATVEKESAGPRPHRRIGSRLKSVDRRRLSVRFFRLLQRASRQQRAFPRLPAFEGPEKSLPLISPLGASYQPARGDSPHI